MHRNNQYLLLIVCNQTFPLGSFGGNLYMLKCIDLE